MSADFSQPLGVATAVPDPAPVSYAIQSHFPPAFGYEGLSILLGRAIPTLQADKCRKPESLPPACSPPGSKSPRWLLTDVLAWLAQCREPAVEPSPVVEKLRKQGAPTKAEQVRRKRALAREKGGEYGAR